MATIIITVTDSEAGTVNVTLDYDPPVDVLDSKQTNAQLMVSRMLLVMRKVEEKYSGPEH